MSTFTPVHPIGHGHMRIFGSIVRIEIVGEKLDGRRRFLKIRLPGYNRGPGGTDWVPADHVERA